MLSSTSMNPWVPNLKPSRSWMQIYNSTSCQYWQASLLSSDVEKLLISLHSLGLASRRSEKTKPSCLDFVLIFREAARIKRESSPHMSLRDCVWGAVGEYNKTVTKDMLFKQPMVVMIMPPPFSRFQIFINFPWGNSSQCLAQPWELASEGWCPPVDIQPFEMPSEALGHAEWNVWVHQARNGRPDVMKRCCHGSKKICYVMTATMHLPVSYVHRKHGWWLLHPWDEAR